MPAIETPLTRRLVVLALIVVAFIALTLVVEAGWLGTLDHQVLLAASGIWSEPLHALFQVIAELGGLEVTSILMLGLLIFLWRGFGADALAVLAYPAGVLLEVLYKMFFYHPGPPRALTHSDGPSITERLTGAGSNLNSFPSGHVVRAVVTYGLIAFVVRRLAPSRAVRRLAVPAAVVLIVVESFDRIYLDVHWESDVIGGLLLGSIALLSATVWLDRPIRTDN